jgi:hypothetical protein
MEVNMDVQEYLLKVFVQSRLTEEVGIENFGDEKQFIVSEGAKYYWSWLEAEDGSVLVLEISRIFNTFESATTELRDFISQGKPMFGGFLLEDREDGKVDVVIYSDLILVRDLVTDGLILDQNLELIQASINQL